MPPMYWSPGRTEDRIEGYLSISELNVKCTSTAGLPEDAGITRSASAVGTPSRTRALSCPKVVISYVVAF